MTKLTPMMAQYKKIKAEYLDCILMFRLGDFYEMFFEDAKEASEILQITLTSRGKGGASETPMCGIPFHAVSGYLAKLTRAGKKVAICDQVTQPNGTGIVEREVVRIVTPGTTFDENVLNSKANNFVACIVTDGKTFAFSFSDITTGEFKVIELNSLKDLKSEIQRVDPAECVCSESLTSLFGNDRLVFPYEYSGEAEEDLKKQFALSSLKPFDLEGHDLAILASASLLAYLQETQKSELKHIQKVQMYRSGSFMPLSSNCIRNLELFYSATEKKVEGSLVSILDQTVSSMGGRMIRKWLMHPLVDEKEIVARHKRVESLVQNSSLLRELRESLKQIYDIERLLSKLSLGSGNARDLIAMKKSLGMIPDLKKLIDSHLPDQLIELRALVELLEKSVKEDSPLSVRDGGMIAEGNNSELDELLSIRSEGKGFIQEMQKREIEKTGITSLKVKFNKVFGYYIEISKTNLASVPENYIRKQTLVNAERFITPELKEYEEKVLNADDRIKELEYELFYELRMEVVKEIVNIQTNAKAIAELDVLANMAYIAVKNNYCRPVIDQDAGMTIVEGRHPVIEQMVGQSHFIANDCTFSQERNFMLITGPNMGGKSTYLRQVALISLMAQIGSFVPAKEARLSIVDRIFTRVGASDNLARGESTFMVEMTEAAYILNNATDKSLIILDEIGRGTSTYDGVSIAWAIMEFVHDQLGAKTLFATHYHELIELASDLKSSVNLSVAVKENEKEGVVFLYKIVETGIDKSYGIEVARLAGLPREVVARARGVLGELENKHIKKAGKMNVNQMDLFMERQKQEINLAETKLLSEIKKLDLNSLTPIEALNKLSEIKKKM
jgi:DNA mismatch repair protein MutS